MEPDGVCGEIRLNGEDLLGNFERMKYKIGSVPQENVLHEAYRVSDELRDAAILRLPNDTTRKEIREKVEEVIEKLGLEKVKKSRISQLSGGEKKRVNIGIELVADRDVLCLDEPDARAGFSERAAAYEVVKITGT